MPASSHDSTFQYERIQLDKMRVAAAQVFGKAMLEDLELTTTRAMFPVNDLLVELRTNVFTEELCKDEYVVSDKRQIKHFKSWWQHLKASIFPSWLLRRFPIQYSYEFVQFTKTVKITRKATYPLSNLVASRDRTFLDVMGKPVIKDYVEVVDD